MDVLRATPEEIAAVAASRKAQGLPPPLGGGGGPWVLNVKQHTIEAKAPAGKKSETTAAISAFSLFSEVSPTIMEEWAITDVRIPCGYSTFVPLAENFVTRRMQLIMRLGGDIVWSAEETISGKTPEGEATAVFANIILAANFNQPIIVRRGRTLTLEALATFRFEKTIEGNTAFLWVGSESTPTGFLPAEGTIHYTSQQLSGHRTL